MNAPFKDQRSLKQHQRRRTTRISSETLRLSLVLRFFPLSLFITHSAAVYNHCLYLLLSLLIYQLFGTCASCCFSPVPTPYFLSLPFSHSVFLILRGSSPVIHPGQATIPYKASGSPHLASYFHIRSAVTDRVYTGSSLECKAATPSAAPPNLTVLSAPWHKPGHTSSLLSLRLLFLQLLSPLFPPHFSPFLLNSSSHLTPLYFLFSLYFFSSFSQLHLSHLSVSSIPSHPNAKDTKRYARVLAA